MHPLLVFDLVFLTPFAPIVFQVDLLPELKEDEQEEMGSERADTAPAPSEAAPDGGAAAVADEAVEGSDDAEVRLSRLLFLLPFVRSHARLLPWLPCWSQVPMKWPEIV
jgi:hypothetical protein